MSLSLLLHLQKGGVAATKLWSQTSFWILHHVMMSRILKTSNFSFPMGILLVANPEGWITLCMKDTLWGFKKRVIIIPIITSSAWKSQKDLGKRIVTAPSPISHKSLLLTSSPRYCRVGKVWWRGDRDSYCTRLGRTIWATSSPWSSKGDLSSSGPEDYLWSLIESWSTRPVRRAKVRWRGINWCWC